MTALFSRRSSKTGRSTGLKQGTSVAEQAPLSRGHAFTLRAGTSKTDQPLKKDDLNGAHHPRVSVDAKPIRDPQQHKSAAKSKSLPIQPQSRSEGQGDLADDFGRLISPDFVASNGGASTLPSRSNADRKGPRASGEASVPTGTIRGPSLRRLAADLPPPPLSGVHAPTAAIAAASTSGGVHGKEAFPYGYTHEGWDTEITLPSALKVLDLCAKEIRERGLDCPLIFSSMALDLSAATVASLLKALAASDFADLYNSPLGEEVRFANPHNLAALIKWTLARLSRFYTVPVPGTQPTRKGEQPSEDVVVVQQRGWLDIDLYTYWKEEETAAEYPWTAFTHFADLLDPDSADLLTSLFSLLSSTCSYSLKNGMTPSKLARHFGVTLFGLPEDETFARTYDAYHRASNATEHLLLAYIRDVAVYEVLPIRLMSHLEGYPGILSPSPSLPARHVRQVPVTHIERQVRLYSQDLIQSACEIDVAWLSSEWEACCSASEHHGKPPQLSDRLKKLINLRGAVQQVRDTTLTMSDSAGGLSIHSKAQSDDPTYYGSIAQEQWGNFLSDGFTGTDTSKLSFDLHESQRRARSGKRNTVLWSDFTDVGFEDPDGGGLDAVLSFDDGLKEDLTRWPSERADLLARLRDTTSHMPSFAYDTAPKIIARPSSSGESGAGQPDEAISGQLDEVFAEVWADYLIGNGWSNRDELTHRSANFVVLQYKSRANKYTVSGQSDGSSKATSAAVPLQTSLGSDIPPDDRQDAAWFVIQEIVPSGYRSELEAVGRVKSRSRPSIRKLKVFRKLRKDKHLTSISSSGITHQADQDYFPPGTKKLSLGQQIPGASDTVDLHRIESTRKERDSILAAANGSKSSLFSTPLVPDREKDQPGESRVPPNQQSGASRIVSAVRKKTLRRSEQVQRERNNERDCSASGPLPPPKMPGGLTAPPQSVRGNKAQNGGFPTSASGNQSFCSADFESRSLHESGDELRTADTVRAMGRRGSIRRHLGKSDSKDDTWVAIVTKSPDGLQEAELALPQLSISHEPTVRLSSPGSNTSGAAPPLSSASTRLDDSLTFSIASTRDRPDSTETSQVVNPSSESETRDTQPTSTPNKVDETLSIFPAPPLSMTAAKSPASLMPSNDLPQVLIADRSILRPVATDAQSREERISAAQARARELRSKLHPVDARKAQQQPVLDGQTLLLENSATVTASQASSTKSKLDPFAKNPTSGKVASIAARFGAAPISPQGSAISSRPLSSTKTDPSPGPSPSGPERSPSPLQLATYEGSATSGLPSAGNGREAADITLRSTLSVADRPLTMVDPDVPPSPRRPESMIGNAMMGDTDSIGPDDAASNYSRSTEENGGEPATRGWDKASHAQHLSQQAMQNRFLSGAGSAAGTNTDSEAGETSGRPSGEETISFPPSFSTGAGEDEDVYAFEQRLRGERELELQEESDSFSPLTAQFREPYQPGQPLENLQEESESMLSGSH